MNVLLISQCNKRALTETRRILDQFAERRGDRSWQTAITMEGLRTLRKLLRKTARKNTAVACHWIRGKDHSELMWVVGDASRFNEQGAVPTNTTRRNVLRSQDENDWHTGEAIHLLARLAALLHDLGKASVAFQGRLRTPPKEKNLYRHEWVSLRLFLAFVGSDDDQTWLNRLANPESQGDDSWTAPERFFRDGLDGETPPPFKNLPPLAAAIAWLVLTHHRLPVKPVQNSGRQAWLGKRSLTFNLQQLPSLLASVTHDWNEIKQNAEPKSVEPYWSFKHKLPVFFPKWKTQAAKLAERLSQINQAEIEWLDNPYVMHLARMTLMLADHHYSSLPPDSTERVKGDSKGPLFANTHKDGKLKQPLDEHLLGVAKLAGTIAHALPGFELYLPRLVRHKGLKKRSRIERFRWQDRAADAASAMRDRSNESGAFIVNMASTGCGKTLANARILNALADPAHGMRATFALGLRTLTLQTGRSYREDLLLGEDELAIRVGGSASRELFEYYEAEAEASGSLSIQELIDEDSHVLFEGQHTDHPMLSKAMANPKINSLVSAPVLVCTVDHLVPAAEAQRAGRQIAPMLRLMSSDLVLDELDDFDLADLPALTRLVFWAGLLGSRVLLSSATLPPSLVEGMFLAYKAGRHHYGQNRGAYGGQDVIPQIPCLWLDEFSKQDDLIFEDADFAEKHAEFVAKRVKALDADVQREGAKRSGVLIPLHMQSNQRREQYHREFAGIVRDAMIRAHDAHHEVCPHSGKHVSFGLVRMANIEPLIDVAQEVFRLGAPQDYQIHLCVYHSRFPMLLRSTIEHQLDTTLNRREQSAVYQRADIRSKLSSATEKNHLFVVLGSPVTEVGRDHDYDWAVVEPSSMRSLIQLAGRVQRHRQKPCSTPNIFIFDTNLRHFTAGKGHDGYPKAAFVRPGFELDKAGAREPYRLTTHRLGKLLKQEEYQVISSIPRIQTHSPPLEDKQSLVDLEHARLVEQMLPSDIQRSDQPNAASCWQYPQAALTWILPQQQRFRDDSTPETPLVFLPDDDEEQLVVHRIHQQAKRGTAAVYVDASNLVRDIPLEMGQRIAPWGQYDLMQLLVEQAEHQDKPLLFCGERYTTVNAPNSEQGWWFHPVLGFGKKK